MHFFCIIAKKPNLHLFNFNNTWAFLKIYFSVLNLMIEYISRMRIFETLKLKSVLGKNYWS